MSRLKIPRPPKYVLVRTELGHLYVLSRKWFISEQAKGVHVDAEIVASSDDMRELEKFQKLTEES